MIKFTLYAGIREIFMKRIIYVFCFAVLMFSLLIGGVLFANYKSTSTLKMTLDKEVIAKGYDKTKDKSNWKDLAKARTFARERLESPYQDLKKIHKIKAVPLAPI